MTPPPPLPPPLVVLRRKNCYKLSLWLLPLMAFFTSWIGCFFIIQKAPKLVRAGGRALTPQRCQALAPCPVTAVPSCSPAAGWQGWRCQERLDLHLRRCVVVGDGLLAGHICS